MIVGGRPPRLGVSHVLRSDGGVVGVKVSGCLPEQVRITLTWYDGLLLLEVSHRRGRKPCAFKAAVRDGAWVPTMAYSGREARGGAPLKPLPRRYRDEWEDLGRSVGDPRFRHWEAALAEALAVVEVHQA